MPFVAIALLVPVVVVVHDYATAVFAGEPGVIGPVQSAFPGAVAQAGYELPGQHELGDHQRRRRENQPGEDLAPVG
jgi:hypothetical protein